MIKDPHKSMEDKPMKDMNATHMKSNVKAPVMNNGGADMAKVKDAPAMNDPMKKINATYGMSKEKVTNQVAKEYMNMSASKNKMMKKEGVNRAHRYLETKPGSLEEAVLKARGLIK
jgi:DNA polymerase III delta prime subunit